MDWLHSAAVGIIYSSPIHHQPSLLWYLTVVLIATLFHVIAQDNMITTLNSEFVQVVRLKSTNVPANFITLVKVL